MLNLPHLTQNKHKMHYSGPKLTANFEALSCNSQEALNDKTDLGDFHQSRNPSATPKRKGARLYDLHKYLKFYPHQLSQLQRPLIHRLSQRLD